MTDIEWGERIFTNGKPDWYRGEQVQWLEVAGATLRAHEWDESDWRVVCGHGFRLPANHPYYMATSRGFTYWPGGESAPEDWDGGECLMSNGVTTEPSWWTREEPRGYDIIGYRKRTEQPAIAPELVARMVRLVETMAQGTQSVLEQFHPVNTGFGMAYTEAKAINDILNHDPDLTLAKSIVGDAEAIALAIKAARENGRG